MTVGQLIRIVLSLVAASSLALAWLGLADALSIAGWRTVFGLIGIGMLCGQIYMPVPDGRE